MERGIGGVGRIDKSIKDCCGDYARFRFWSRLIDRDEVGGFVVEDEGVKVEGFDQFQREKRIRSYEFSDKYLCDWQGGGGRYL